MECPKCGYERETGDTHCSLCGVDFALLERQQAEKKALKAAAKKKKSQQKEKLELESSDAGEHAGAVSGICPKCGGDRREGAVECPQCGVIYEKHEQMLAQKEAEKQKKKEEEARRFAEERARIQQEAREGIKEARQKREKHEERTAKIKEQKEVAVEKASEAVEKITEVASSRVQEMLDRLKGNSRRIMIYAAVILGVIIVGWGITTTVRTVLKNAELKRIIAQKEEEQRRIAEEQRKAAEYFKANRFEIVTRLKSLVDQRQYTLFEKELHPYDIPQLESYVSDIRKYLEEIKLLDVARRIPGREYGKNYEAYLKLHALNPGKKLYNDKLIYYRKKLAEQKYQEARSFLGRKKRYKTELLKAMAAIDKAIQLEGYKKKYTAVRYKLKSQQLLFFEGNDRVQIAVRNDGLTKGATGGQRKIYVWVKNVGREAFFPSVDYFVMVGKNNKRYKYNDSSRSLMTQLASGQTTEGLIFFYTSQRPKELIFNHPIVGKVSRRFP